MSPVRINAYPEYDVRKIVHALRHPTHDLVNVYAHRGLRLLGGSTENSLSSVAAAAAEGYEGIEVDVRYTKDRQVVLFHDEGLGRNTDVVPPDGQSQFNPFTAKGFSPLVKDTKWFGDMEHLHLRDDRGDVTSEKPVLLKELLSFIRDEGINMLVQLDMKDLDALEPAFEILTQATNAAGVPATEWCVWKCLSDLFPTPQDWESQQWVQDALKSGREMLYMPLFITRYDNTMDDIRLWASRDYVVTIEIHIPKRNGPLQEVLDFVRTDPCWSKGLTTWRISGDVPRGYYEGHAEMGAIRWDDSAHRPMILASGPDVPIQYDEWRGINAVSGELGRPPSSSEQDELFDGRAHLGYLLDQGFTSVVADPFDDLSGKLKKLGRRNVDRMLQTRPKA